MAITTNIPGLSLAQELQALKKQQLSNLIASGVQPQDAETLSNGDGDFLNRFSKLDSPVCILHILVLLGYVE